jgi:DNA polymerase-3 subunit delta'
MADRLAPEHHDTLDGIPEPAENPHLHGHAEAADILASAYRAGKLPHALLVSGAAGIGKATLAFRLANHLLAHPQASRAPQALQAPDPASPVFRQVAQGAHPGVLHLTRPPNDKGTGFKTVLTIEEIRRINRFLSMTSHDGSWRVVIVDPADDMNTNAANALLKNLEEPPSRVLFVLITHLPGALLPTIRSRCQVVRLSPLAPGELVAALTSLGLEVPAGDGVARALAARSGGSVRRAILLSQYGGVEIAEKTEKLARAHDMREAHRLADALAARDAAIQFELFNEHVLALLSQAASAAARTGDIVRADRLAQQWQQSRLAIAETDTYNLDRKQHALTMIARLHESLRM